MSSATRIKCLTHETKILESGQTCVSNMNILENGDFGRTEARTQPTIRFIQLSDDSRPNYEVGCKKRSRRNDGTNNPSKDCHNLDALKDKTNATYWML